MEDDPWDTSKFCFLFNNSTEESEEEQESDYDEDRVDPVTEGLLYMQLHYEEDLEKAQQTTPDTSMYSQEILPYSLGGIRPYLEDSQTNSAEPKDNDVKKDLADQFEKVSDGIVRDNVKEAEKEEVKEAEKAKEEVVKAKLEVKKEEKKKKKKKLKEKMDKIDCEVEKEKKVKKMKKAKKDTSKLLGKFIKPTEDMEDDSDCGSRSQVIGSLSKRKRQEHDSTKKAKKQKVHTKSSSDSDTDSSNSSNACFKGKAKGIVKIVSDSDFENDSSSRSKDSSPSVLSSEDSSEDEYEVKPVKSNALSDSSSLQLNITEPSVKRQKSAVQEEDGIKLNLQEPTPVKDSDLATAVINGATLDDILAGLDGEL